MSQLYCTISRNHQHYQIIDFIIDGNGILEPKELQNIVLPNNIDFTKGIIFSGKGPVWLFAHFVHLAHIAVWVGIFDPRRGAVIVQTHVATRELGSIIPADEIYPLLPKHSNTSTNVKTISRGHQKIIAFLGPPHSGKSIFLQCIYHRLREVLSPEKFQRDVFVLRACPDGEGDWFSDVATENGQLLRYKKQFDDTFVEKTCTYLQTLAESKKIILVDCGGKIDKKNQHILNYCTHAILVSHSTELFAEWRGAVTASEVTILAELETVLYKSYEILSTKPLRLKIGKLERGGKTDFPLTEILSQLTSYES